MTKEMTKESLPQSGSGPTGRSTNSQDQRSLRKSRKTFATDTFRILNNRMLYYRRVLKPENGTESLSREAANQPIGVQGQQKINQKIKNKYENCLRNQKIKNKYENCLRIKKLLHRAIRHLYDDSNITPQTLKKKMKLKY